MSTSSKTYLKLAAHYRDCLQKHGDRARGMDWPRERDNQRRFEVMTDLFLPQIASHSGRVSVLDFGCGTSHYYEFLKARKLAQRIRYVGIDILPESISISKRKFPNNAYYCRDILTSREPIGTYQFITINGVFTQKRNMMDLQMKTFLQRVLFKLFPLFTHGLAFNTMSDQVDFKRRTSFHLNLDWASRFFTQKLTRNFIVRHDYGLYENTFYLLKKDYRL